MCDKKNVSKIVTTGLYIFLDIWWSKNFLLVHSELFQSHLLAVEQPLTFSSFQKF